MSSLYIARSSRVAARMLEGEMMIMSGHDSTLFTLNRTATILWQSADGVTPLEEIVEQRICVEFDVETARRCRMLRLSRVNWLSMKSCKSPRSPFLSHLPSGVKPMSDTCSMRLPRRRCGRMSLSYVQLDLTYRCNERCVHCYLDHHDYGEMTTAEIKRLCSTRWPRQACLHLTLSGGEIFLRKDFFEIVEHARQLMFCVKLKTNAVLIGKRKRRGCAISRFIDIQVSIYSHRPEVHDAITLVPGSLKRSSGCDPLSESAGSESHRSPMF